MRTSCSRCASAIVSGTDRKSTRLNSSHLVISYAVFCLKKKKNHDLTVWPAGVDSSRGLCQHERETANACANQPAQLVAKTYDQRVIRPLAAHCADAHRADD